MADINNLNTGIGFVNTPSTEMEADDFDPATPYPLEEDKDPVQENLELSPFVAHILDVYEKSKTKRLDDETRWLKSYQNYRGIYGPEVQFTSTEKSKAFIKVTKTKVLAAHAQLLDILFSGQKFPIGITPTPKVTKNIEEAVHFDPKEQEGTGPNNATDQLPSTITRKSILDAVGPLKGTLQRLGDKLKSGPGQTPSALTWNPAEIAARNMEKLIQDQLDECEANKELRHTIFEMCLFGSGIMKGPFAVDREYPKWDGEGNYQPIIKTVAEIKSVSIWDCYPDPFARNLKECESWIERHRMSISQLRKLKKRGTFRKQSIDEAIRRGPNYTEEYWEAKLRDYTPEPTNDRYEVIEFWGMVDKNLAENTELEIPKELRDMDDIQVNAWICNGEILRLVLNPFKPVRIPYYAVPYELNPYSFFGVGVAENMLDTQMLMNGFLRLAVDNAVLSSNVVFELDETNLVPGQNMDIYPGKIFRRQGGAPGQALFSTKFQNTTQENLMMFDKMRQLTDEATGMPSYAHGMSGIQSTGRTASGMSMLMSAAAQNIKQVVKNVDDYLLAPLGKSLFSFNMQFNFDPDIVGDLDVVALGTDSLMKTEMKSQKLLQFLQITTNPLDAPFVKRQQILRELAKTLDLDPDATVNDIREASIQAEMLRQMGAQAPGNTTAGGNTPASGVPTPGNPAQMGGGNLKEPVNPQSPSSTASGGGNNGGNQQSGTQPSQPSTSGQ